MLGAIDGREKTGRSAADYQEIIIFHKSITVVGGVDWL